MFLRPQSGLTDTPAPIKYRVRLLVVQHYKRHLQWGDPQYVVIAYYLFMQWIHAMKNIWKIVNPITLITCVKQR